MPTAPTLGNWIGLCALGLIWGASFLGVALALDGFGPVSIAAGRIALGAVTLAAVALIARIPLPRDPRIWTFTAAMAILSNALPFFLLSWSQQHVTSGFAGITMAAIPLFVIGLAHVFVQGERLSVQKAIGFATGLVGVAVLIGPGVLTTTGSALESVARLGCLGASLSYALGAIVTRRCPPVHPVAFGVLALGIASVVMVPLAVAVEGLPPAPPLHAWGALVYLGLLPTGLATLILVGIIRSAGPSFLSQVNYHVPVWSVILGVVVLSEELPGRFILALAIIIGGLMVSRRKPVQAAPTP
ncbi:putative inner membrane transporter YedA [Roseibaca ekhonensis]|uniref:Putative inner membrane transporter YedA n=1 Tax=Roseinatronobacter ekhonensis TaxID=254356 RepID=A0A3B0MZZ5_9RHOB|nr:DMT family transporter [Roseibaca ekhonensis]SUZ33366.1 putative inner membrane transporter YedA [Roseibaca ekhonensis]